MFPLNFDACMNMLDMVMTEFVCHELRFRSNNHAFSNMLDVVVAEPICQDPRSGLGL